MLNVFLGLSFAFTIINFIILGATFWYYRDINRLLNLWIAKATKLALKRRRGF